MQFRPWPIGVFLVCWSVVGPSAPAICGQQQPKPVRQSGSDGFVSLFDGKTLAGWHAVPRESASDWTVRDGAIVGHGSADRLAYLVWKDERLTDFELKLRYRLPGEGNTGVEIRSQPDQSGKRPFQGYHADLGHVGIGPHILGAWDFHFARRKEYPCPRGTQLVIDEDGQPHSNTIRGALTVADVRPHQWNGVRIVARGNHFQFFINGKPASEFTDNAQRGRLDQGAIGLQIHDKGMHVEFKDIRLKRLISTSKPEERVSVGLQKQLMVDEYVIAEKENVTRELGKVTKCGIVLEPTLPTDFIPPPGSRGSGDYERNLKSGKKPDGSRVALDFGFYTTVLWNEKDRKFQMWYMPWRLAGVGYAESKDGIHWTKPLVGKDGKDNIVHLSQSFSCSIDPTVRWGHPEKYKAAFDSNLDRVCQPCLAYSADGIRWSDYNDGKPVTGRAADCFDQILWDPIVQKYRLTCRTDMGGAGGTKEYRSARIMVHNKGNDLRKHPTAWKTIADKIVVDDPKKEKNPWGNPRLQFNWLTCWIYEGVYFVPMNVYTMDQSHFFEGFDYQTRHEKDVLDFYIGTSRDGVNFDKSWIYARRPLVPRGPAGSFDKDGVFPPSQIVTHKGEHWIYYGGASERHYSIGRDMKIGLA
ncbi:MAG: 3-keto-disaccharide hydrolase, partial [Planctomycetota bacterium]